MPELRPDTTYNPTQQVTPEPQPNNDYLRVRSNPDQFGAQIGKAVEGFGAQVGQAGENQFKIEMQKQGLANEHAANMAEMDLAVQGGEVFNQYKGLEGLDASNAKDGFVQKYLDVNKQIRAGLGNQAAQKAYDQLATRRMSFTVQEMNAYAGDQRRKAYRQGTVDSAKLSQDRAATYEVASDPKQLDFEKGNVIHQANTAYTAPDFGRYSTIPAKQGEDGFLKFDIGTQQGKIAQADYDNYINQQLGLFYTNATEILATDPQHGNYAKAVDFFKLHEQDIPPASRASLSAKLAGPYHNEQNRDWVENKLDESHFQYQGSLGESGPSYTTNLGNVKTTGGGFANPTTPIDGATLAANTLRGNQYKGKTLQQIGQTWTGESPDKVAAWVHNVQAGSGINPDQVPDLNNPDVMKLMLRGVALAEKSPEDRKAFNENVISQGVQNSFSGAKANLSQGRALTLDGKVHQSEADYLLEHEETLVEQARQSAKDEGLDSIVQDQRAERMKGRIQEKSLFQRNEIHQLSNQIYSKVMDKDHPFTNMMMLDNSTDPNLKLAWTRLQTLDPYKAGTFQRIIAQNARGEARTLGTDFYTHYDDVLSGKVNSIDELQDYLGSDKDPITVPGIRAIQDELDFIHTPQGQAFAQSERKFLSETQKKVTGQGFYPGIDSAVLNDNFRKTLGELIPQIQAKRADLIRQGKNPNVMFDSEDKENYIGKNVKPPSKADLDKVYFSSIITGNKLPTASPVNTNPGATAIPGKPVLYNTYEDIGKAYQSGTITKEDARKLMHDKFGGFAPKVPAPQ